MNKRHILDSLHIGEDDHVQRVKQMIDLCDQSQRYHQVMVSSFLPPVYRAYVHDILGHFRDLSYMASGGYDEAEYFKLMVHPDYMNLAMTGISVLKLTYNPAYGSIGHRDVLGALMGLGIKRNLVGDILVGQDQVQILVDQAMADYIKSQLTAVGRLRVEGQLQGLESLDYQAPEWTFVHQTVSSLRLDALISSAYQVSRAKALQDIKSEKVKVNHRLVTSSSKLLVEKDLISVRGKGRVVVDSVMGLSKKERIKIMIKKYI